MKSVVIFTSLSMGMVATLLMGFLVGSTVTLIVYLAGSNILLSHALKTALAAQRGAPELDPECPAEMHASSAADSLARKKSPAAKERYRHSHHQDHEHSGTIGTARGHARDATNR